MGVKAISLLLSVVLAVGAMYIPKENGDVPKENEGRKERIMEEGSPQEKREESGGTAAEEKPVPGEKPVSGEKGESEETIEKEKPVSGEKGESEETIKKEKPVPGEKGESEETADGEKPVSGEKGGSEETAAEEKPVSGEEELEEAAAEEKPVPGEDKEAAEGEKPVAEEESQESTAEERSVWRRKAKGSLLEQSSMSVFQEVKGAWDEKYVQESGYFYLYVRKQGDSPEDGHWYRVSMSVPKLSAGESQDIAWDMAYIGVMPKSQTEHVTAWIWTYGSSISGEKDNYSLEIEKGTKWERTRHDGMGTDPVLGEPAPELEEMRPLGYPHKKRYYMLCGKLFYTVNGYRMYFDNSVFRDMGGMDIEPENKQIQKKDSNLKEGEKSWTDDRYFKFAIDTNNVGMTNYGASEEFHHAMYGFYLKPNQYQVTYDANGGSGTVKGQSAVYDKSLKLRANSFVREGYAFAGWNTNASGKGTGYKARQAVKNLTAQHKGKVTLYAQWEPNIYKVTLDRRLSDLEEEGTKAVYEKYETGWYLDKGCASLLADKKRTGNITVPGKTGYVFQGYYSAAAGGTQMIDKSGKLTSAGKADFQYKGDVTWYAHYKCQILCEDYADIPCDFEKISEDAREDVGAVVAYDKEKGQVLVETSQMECSVSMIGKEAGTKVGQFQSAAAGNSASAFSGNGQTAALPMTPRENAAYQLKITARGKVLCDRSVYFKNGRFRTLVKLGVKEKKEIAQGGSISGSAWGTNEEAYAWYRYTGCSELTNIQLPGIVCRYFQYGNVNVAYSGNGATSGSNILEYNVPLESIYQLRKNSFAREEMQEKQTEDGKSYTCSVTYSFQGWNLSADQSYLEQQKEPAIHIYGNAKHAHAVLDRTIQPLETYQAVGDASSDVRLSKYINFWAKWNAFPTITVTPGSSLEFYEGEEVGKEELVSCLTAHDSEDNHKENHPYVANLNDKIRIVRIAYPASWNGSQKAYEKVYQEDVPDDFLLDTYYMKLEKEEEIEAMVTFAVTDSAGNTTEEKIPVKIKYNNYPEIHSEDIFYYFKEEANKGEITEEVLKKRAEAEDAEDGNLTDKIGLKDFDGQVVKMQTKSRSEFELIYQVTDAYKKTSYKTVKLVVVDEDAAIAEMPKYYVRYISQEHLDTLEKNSSWRESENYTYLKQALQNETSKETWKFTHEDVLAVQEWIKESGSGKNDQAANQRFLAKFSHCKQ